MNPSILEHWNRLPPLFCVLIARQGRKPMPLHLIAKRAGMSVQRAQWIYRQDSWARVPVEDMDRFASACGLTMRTFRRQMEYLKVTLKRPYPLSHIEGLRPSVLRNMTRRVTAALHS